MTRGLVPDHEEDVSGLLELVDTLRERVGAIDQLTGDDGEAHENRTIRHGRAKLARAEARQACREVEQVRQRAQELAGLSMLIRDDSARLAGTSGRDPARGPGGSSGAEVLAAARSVHAASSSGERGRAGRLVEEIRHAIPSVCWVQIAVRGDAGIDVSSAGDLPSDAVRSLEDGPRAIAFAGGDTAGTEGTAPAPARAAGVGAVLATPLGGDTAGVLTVAAAHDRFDEATRTIATHLAERAGRALRHVDSAADDVLDAARVVLCRHLAIDPEDGLEALLRVARVTGLPVVDTAERLLAALVPPAPAADPSAAREPATLRDAVSYIERHAADDIGLPEITAAAGVGSRNLQMLFRRHRDLAPLEYLRLVRLDRAHADLQAARPTSGATVSAVAARWRFTHPGRFSVSYRKRFGESPSNTLKF